MRERYIVSQYFPSNVSPIYGRGQTVLRDEPVNSSQFRLSLVAAVVICLGAGLLSNDSLADEGNSDYSVIDNSSDVPRSSESSQSSSNRRAGKNRTRRTQSLDGTGNNINSPDLGSANSAYRRFADSSYSDGLSEPTEGPNARYISNRVFEDHAQNLFSENSVTQWAWTWGQFIDHSIGLRAGGEEPMNTAFDSSDPLELFTNRAGILNGTRSEAAPDTGITKPREQLNVLSSFIDATAVYGSTQERLEWLREGPVDGDMSNNGAKLLMTEDNYLPRAIERGDPDNAPFMDQQGQLLFAPDAVNRMVITGDVRGNENIGLTGVQTLFAREHNRIVDLLPEDWSEQDKFDVARQLVIAMTQYITYEEFLPAVGIELDPADGYQSDADPRITNEFATVGYRAHSMIHGEIEVETEASRYDEAAVAKFLDEGIEVQQVGEEIEIAVPLNVAFHQPQLVPEIGLAPLLAGLGGEPQYRNDEQFDNQLRSVLFQLPEESVEDPSSCLDGPTLNECFTLVHDLGVLDIERARDHGIARYNDLREAYGLERISDFTSVTGEPTDEFPTDDPLVDINDPINDPDILDFVALRDIDGQAVELGSEEADGDAIEGDRRTTLAARLKAIYGSVDQLDAFVGMVSEPHLPNSEFGELQHAIWKQQFEAIRDGDRYFYAWNRSRAVRYFAEPQGESGLTWRRTLAEVIIDNTEFTADDIQSNMFIAAD